MSRLADLGSKLFHANESFRPKIVPTQKLIRGVLNKHFIFSTTSALLVWEIPYFPFYWIPKSSFLPVAKFTDNPSISGIQSSTAKLSVGEKSIETLIVPDSFNSELAGYVKVEFGDLDAWYEELTRVLYHPKDPFHRVDILPSGRSVRVEVHGTVIADTKDEGGVVSLWETNFPGRWYLPPTSVKWEYLKASETKTGCPYKGQASYYDAVIDGKEVKDVVWWYENPTSESVGIRGMVSSTSLRHCATTKVVIQLTRYSIQLCFYPDKVDTFVDGVAIEKIGMPPLSKADRASVGQPRSSCNC